MPNKTAIEWTQLSSNPIRARVVATGKAGHHCEKISPGCEHCYSEAINGRFGTDLPYVRASRDQVAMELNENELIALLKLRKPAKVFIGDMTDIFQRHVPDAMLDRLFAVLAAKPSLTPQILTKRTERMVRYLSDPATPDRVAGEIDRFVRPAAAGIRNDWSGLAQEEFRLWQGMGWPLRNAWYGTSVENQLLADRRIPELLKLRGVTTYLSVEPLLERVDLGLDHECGDPPHGTCPPIPDWVIVGGESGPGARPCDIDWIRSVVDQCRAAGVPCFVKQLGSVPVMNEAQWRATQPTPLLSHANRAKTPAGTVPLLLRDSKGGDPAEWPSDLRVREWPEVAA